MPSSMLRRRLRHHCSAVVSVVTALPSSLLCSAVVSSIVVLHLRFVSPQGIFDLMICCFDLIFELIEGLEQSISDTHNSMKTIISNLYF
ncbi:hypothetical protein F2Q69_00030776 [Brassica cretica]|uniref:Uncharacterized protein n=1 Tax=Brassica cretica TaxID=69181 RepID=A0A8S9S0R1_BRACR|nr:hypothetical protein F2Q69_00030776 [Brassica cretica]